MNCSRVIIIWKYHIHYEWRPSHYTVILFIVNIKATAALKTVFSLIGWFSVFPTTVQQACSFSNCVLIKSLVRHLCLLQKEERSRKVIKQNKYSRLASVKQCHSYWFMCKHMRLVQITGFCWTSASNKQAHQCLSWKCFFNVSRVVTF